MRTNAAWENFSDRPVGLAILPEWKRIAFLCIVVFVFVGRAYGQSPPKITDISPKQVRPPALQITSPANSSIVNPGQAVSVSVTSPANTSFMQVAVIGEDPIGFSSIQTGVPATFSFAIPANVASRKYTLTAFGIAASGQNVESNPILIDVERPDLPVSISVQTRNIIFSGPGETSPIVLRWRHLGRNRILERGLFILEHERCRSRYKWDRHCCGARRAVGDGGLYAERSESSDNDRHYGSAVRAQSIISFSLLWQPKHWNVQYRPAGDPNERSQWTDADYQPQHNR
jgi:hypothetical protein